MIVRNICLFRLAENFGRYVFGNFIETQAIDWHLLGEKQTATKTNLLIVQRIESQMRSIGKLK